MWHIFQNLQNLSLSAWIYIWKLQEACNAHCRQWKAARITEGVQD
jgi:hypothetical protein